ncbi:Ser/Thr protein kinase RdoA (MazF antagonist) [Zeaxanthinibacter enoshimensis]|uniref:Ser/Thr protein kinase RdoA (MazF antagonist) n=2 Tax=Zeaxanthinibacter enoshimensis TaxID=392009 RepID=A0A4R6TPP8_9FLAO|nr:Ser/Thr protein kinase RdoA (MazF antagonist) [Zeaxanthinibacter enoshimensis]
MDRPGIQEIFSKFSNCPADSARPLNQGLINDTFQVRDVEGKLYILQKINREVFSEPGLLMENIAAVLPLLSAPDYTRLELYPTLEGKLSYQDGQSEHWRLLSFIQGSVAFDLPPNLEVAENAGWLLGKFHSLLQHADPSPFNVLIPDFHDLQYRFIQFEKALEIADPERLQKAKPILGFVTHTAAILQQLVSEDLPLRLCHNDTKLNNMLFSARDHAPLCLIDLDTIMPGHLHYDLGDALRTVVSTAPEDERQLENIGFSEPHFTAFIEGLSQHLDFMNEEEKKEIPNAVAYMPFMHGLRALTDYLEGDIYYKVNSPEQNLERSYSLFRFTELALSKREFMEHIIREKL